MSIAYHSYKKNALYVDVTARLAQSAERKALNLVVVGSSPTVGVMLTLKRANKQPTNSQQTANRQPMYTYTYMRL